MGPDRPNFKSYSHITALQPVGTVPGPFRPTFGLPGQPAGQLAGQLIFGCLTVATQPPSPSLSRFIFAIQITHTLHDWLLKVAGLPSPPFSLNSFYSIANRISPT